MSMVPSGQIVGTPPPGYNIIQLTNGETVTSAVGAPLPAGATLLAAGSSSGSTGTTGGPAGQIVGTAPAGYQIIQLSNGETVTSAIGAPIPPGATVLSSGTAAGGAGGSSSPPSSADAAQTQANNSAMGILQNELASWGLGDLSQWAWGEITSGKSVDQIIYDLRQTPEYKSSIFGQTNTLRASNNLPVMDENTILQYKDQAVQIARASGLPSGFITDGEMAQLMGQDVSVTELNDRVTKGYVAAMQAPQEVRDTLAAWGVQPSALAAYYLDPSKALPMLEQQLAGATIGGSAVRTGYGTLDQATATRLAQLGVSQAAADTGFKQLAADKELFNPLPGEAGTAPIGEGVQLGAAFEANSADQLAIQRAADARAGVFRGGGAYGETATGLIGTGQARPA